jgi:hypothetical protein
MELSKEDNILLQGFIGGRLDELERNALLTRLENEPHLKREFERMTDKELSTFIRRFEREKLRIKLSSIREDAADDFEKALNRESQGSFGLSSKSSRRILYNESAYTGNNNDTKHKSRSYNKFISAAAVIAVIALISGLGIWYFEKGDKAIKVADKIQTLDTIKIVNKEVQNDTSLDQIINTNKTDNYGDIGPGDYLKIVTLMNIRVINKNNLGFGPKAAKKDSLVIKIISHDDEVKYLCYESRMIIFVKRNIINQFENLNAQQFVYISGSEILDTGLYFNMRNNYYFLKCNEQPQILAKSIVKDQIELEELEELFYLN